MNTICFINVGFGYILAISTNIHVDDIIYMECCDYNGNDIAIIKKHINIYL